MITKSQIKFIKSLQQKKYRQESGLFVVEGIKGVNELLSASVEPSFLFATKQHEGTTINSEIEWVSSQEMSRISSLKNAPGILAVAKQEDLKHLVKPQSNWTLALDNISDPGNLGTILRTGDWFGWNNIVLNESCVDEFNPKVIQATMGSIFHLSIERVALKPWLESQKKNIYGMDMGGEDLFDSEINEGIIVIGSESHGLSEGIRETITKFIRIPGKGQAESLNAAITAAITMSQLSRNS